jgi:hypothetical protein
LDKRVSVLIVLRRGEGKRKRKAKAFYLLVLMILINGPNGGNVRSRAQFFQREFSILGAGTNQARLAYSGISYNDAFDALLSRSIVIQMGRHAVRHIAAKLSSFKPSVSLLDCACVCVFSTSWHFTA